MLITPKQITYTQYRMQNIQFMTMTFYRFDKMLKIQYFNVIRSNAKYEYNISELKNFEKLLYANRMIRRKINNESTGSPWSRIMKNMNYTICNRLR